MCYYKNKHPEHKITDINNEEELKKENISIEESSKDIEDNKNKLEELKNKIENEMIKIDNIYDKVDKEITKSYEIKHEKLIKEEEGLKDKLKNEVTKIKENLELNLSKISELLRNCERIIKGIKSFKEEDNNMIKKLNYVSNINKNQKEINMIFQ
jgi:DNA repair exonuclease SbcCD ATPase subunit